ncbi:MAG: polysaccharide export protein EpsE [Rickettsiales bacterium]|nr:polysaccharide export protein EpsE [Rickettsiales bacterium]|tara:strand:+ start:54 stop:854 length:801 start_codon:yes stop_codon:yes gene_type:complete
MKIHCSPVRLIIIFGALFLVSCRAYKQDILFQLDENFTEEQLSEPLQDAEGNYTLRKGDYFDFRVYTHDGERIIDPDFELRQLSGGANMNQQNQSLNLSPYLITEDGRSHLPMIGFVTLQGKTVVEAEQELAGLYDEFYASCYVRVQVVNRRVVVLNSTGSAVIPLENENMSIAEVLALAGGVNFGSRAHNIRLIRGDLSNPEVHMIDLSTISGMRSTVIGVQPGDIIYVEPWRRPWLEGLRDVSSIIGITTGVLTLIFFIQNSAR